MSEMRATDMLNVRLFLSRMQAQSDEFRSQERAEIQLDDAVKNYEKVFGVSLRVTMPVPK